MITKSAKFTQKSSKNFSKRANCDPIYISPELREQLCAAFERKYQIKGQFNISRFLNYWQQKLHSKPPTAQTIRNLRSRLEQTKFEYWLIDGCCRILCDFSYEEWLAKQRYSSTNTRDAELLESMVSDRHQLQNPSLEEVIKGIAADLQQIDLLCRNVREKLTALGDCATGAARSRSVSKRSDRIPNNVSGKSF